MKRIPAVQVVISALDINAPAETFRERARLAKAKAATLRQQAALADQEAEIWGIAADEIDQLLERIVIPQLRMDPAAHRGVDQQPLQSEHQEARNA